MTAERAIHLAMFVLLLVGLCGITAWAIYIYLSDTAILKLAGIALSWGIILSILYLAFRKMEWDWWS